MAKRPTNSRPVRVLYFTHPGDVARSFRAWNRGARDELEVSETYSGQFFDVIRRNSFDALVVSGHERRDLVRSGSIVVKHRPPRLKGSGGVAYHLAALGNELMCIARAIRYRPDVVVVSSAEHWWVFTALHWLGIRVIPALHCTLWKGVDPPTGRKAALLLRLNGWFWRTAATSSLCISETIARQVRAASGSPRGSLRVCVPSYSREFAAGMRPAPWRPFVVAYFGRITRDKGVGVALEAASAVRDRFGSDIRWEFCGDGPERRALEQDAERLGVMDVVRFRGHIPREVVRDALESASVVIAPTTADFPEGLNKSLIEAGLAGRPTITTTVVPAAEMMTECTIVIPPGDAAALARAVIGLAEHERSFEALRHGAGAFRERFGREYKTWGDALEEALLEATADSRAS